MDAAAGVVVDLDGPGVFDLPRADGAGVFERVLVLVVSVPSKSNTHREQTRQQKRDIENRHNVLRATLAPALVIERPRSTVVVVAADASIFFLFSFCRSDAERVIRPPSGISDAARVYLLVLGFSMAAVDALSLAGGAGAGSLMVDIDDSFSFSSTTCKDFSLPVDVDTGSLLMSGTGSTCPLTRGVVSSTADGLCERTLSLAVGVDSESSSSASLSGTSMSIAPASTIDLLLGEREPDLFSAAGRIFPTCVAACSDADIGVDACTSSSETTTTALGSDLHELEPLAAGTGVLALFGTDSDAAGVLDVRSSDPEDVGVVIFAPLGFMRETILRFGVGVEDVFALEPKPKLNAATVGAGRVLGSEGVRGRGAVVVVVSATSAAVSR